MGMAFSLDAKQFAAIDDNDNVTLFDVDSGKQARRWKAQERDENNNIVIIRFANGGLGKPVGFMPDGRSVATVALNGGNYQTMIYLWDTATGKSLRKFAVAEQERQIYRFHISADGRTLAIMGNDHVSLWSMATGKSVAKLDNLGMMHPQGMINLESMVFSPDGKLI